MRLSVLTRMMGTNISMTVAILFRVFHSYNVVGLLGPKAMRRQEATHPTALHGYRVLPRLRPPTPTLPTRGREKKEANDHSREMKRDLIEILFAEVSG
jgi:hypothetical protein